MKKLYFPLEASSGGGSKAIPNWNENNPSSDSYVQNRTHYFDNRTELIDQNWTGDFSSQNAPTIIQSYEPEENSFNKIYKLTDTVTGFDTSQLKVHWIVYRKGDKDHDPIDFETTVDYMTLIHDYFAEALGYDETTIQQIIAEYVDESTFPQEHEEKGTNVGDAYIAPYGWEMGVEVGFEYINLFIVTVAGTYDPIGAGAITYGVGVYAIAHEVNTTEDDYYTKFVPTLYGTAQKLPDMYLPDSVAERFAAVNERFGTVPNCDVITFTNNQTVSDKTAAEIVRMFSNNKLVFINTSGAISLARFGVASYSGGVLEYVIIQNIPYFYDNKYKNTSFMITGNNVTVINNSESVSEVKNDTDLVIAEASGGGRTLNDLSIGDTLHIKESGTYVDFTLVEKTTQNDAVIVTLLRNTASDTGTFNGSYTSSYRGSVASNWCINTYYNRFTNYVKNYIVEKTITFITGNGNDSQALKCFLPSATELGVASGEGNYSWFSSDTDRSLGVKYWTRSYRSYQDGPRFYYIKENGQADLSYGAGYFGMSSGYRPCIAFSGDTPVTSANQIDEDGSIIYAGTIDKLQDGNNYYKFSDQDARASITAIKDGTSIDSFSDVETEISTLSSQKANKPTTTTITLDKDDWVSNEQTVSVTGMTSSKIVQVSPSPSSYSDYGDAEVRCTTQGTGTLTFECASVPTTDIDVNVIVWEV